MEKYRELTDRHQQEVNEFPMFWAFNDAQFAEGMAKLGLKKSDTDKIYSMGYGGYYKKTDAPAFHEMLNRHDRELKEAMQDEEFAYDAFSYELANHEYIITYDLEPTLDALGLSLEDVNSSPVMVKALKKAVDDYIEWHETH